MTTPNSTIQLDHWSNALAPLNEAERASVNALADWVGSNKRRGSSSNGAVQASQSQSNLDGLNKEKAAEGNDLNKDVAKSTRQNGELEWPNEALTDAPSYLAWFAKQQALIATSSRTSHTKALQDISRAADDADALLDHLEAARVHIAELRAGARMVEEGTEGLREDAENMVERIDHLSHVADALALRLTYFAILPSTTSFLSSPSLSLVTTNEFTLTLNRLDVALAFIRAHPQYRDASLYRMRFEHCIVRAGTLIRMYVIGRLKDLNRTVFGELKEWEKSRYAKGKEKEFDVDGHAMMTLEDPSVRTVLWDRFETEADDLQRVLHELEKRAAEDADVQSRPLRSSGQDFGKEKQKEGDNEEAAVKGKGDDEEGNDEAGVEVFRAPEFTALLQECREAYVETRRLLLVGMIANCVARIEVIAQHPGDGDAGAEAQQQSSSDASASKNETSATARLLDRCMLFLTALNEAESRLFARFFDVSSDNGQAIGNVDALHAHLRTLAAPIDERVKPGLASEGGLAGLSSATLRSLDTWRDYFVRFVS